MWHWCFSVEVKSQNELKHLLLEKEEEHVVYEKWSWFGEIRIPSVSELHTASEASPFYDFHYSYT